VPLHRRQLLRSGIGKRLDGWPNRDLNPGAIIALSPALPAATKAIYNSWGKGKYDPRFNQDGKNGPQVIPPAYGLKDIHRITSTGDGEDLAYWNRYVGVTQMGGHGSFTEQRTGVKVTNGTDDQVSGKLAALQAYQLSLPAPVAPAGSFDTAAAARGEALFNGIGNCASCHSGAQFTDANLRLHSPTDTVLEAAWCAELRVAQRHQAIPHRPVAGTMATRPLFPQRFSRYAQGCRGELQLTEDAGIEPGASGGSRRAEYLKSL
jgi:hypothetical protein